MVGCCVARRLKAESAELQLQATELAKN